MLLMLLSGVAAGSQIRSQFFPDVVADELRIGQVLTNLITNAARYTSPGTAVEVRLWVEGGQVEVGIVDDGPGVPPDRFEHIFEKYGRADDARAGSGLGLYLARGIARAHGGEVVVEESDEASTAVVVRVPVTENPNTDDE